MEFSILQIYTFNAKSSLVPLPYEAINLEIYFIIPCLLYRVSQKFVSLISCISLTFDQNFIFTWNF